MLVLEEIDLAHLTTVALQYHAYRARSAGLTLVQDLQPVRIRGDATRLTQVIDNLVRNALTHAGEGGSVGVRLAEVPGGGARIEVRDSGPGVEPGSEETIFDAYAQIGAGGQRGEEAGPLRWRREDGDDFNFTWRGVGISGTHAARPRPGLPLKLRGGPGQALAGEDQVQEASLTS